jgi:hypothetical protein
MHQVADSVMPLCALSASNAHPGVVAVVIKNSVT